MRCLSSVIFIIDTFKGHLPLYPRLLGIFRYEVPAFHAILRVIRPRYALPKSFWSRFQGNYPNGYLRFSKALVIRHTRYCTNRLGAIDNGSSPHSKNTGRFRRSKCRSFSDIVRDQSNPIIKVPKILRLAFGGIGNLHIYFCWSKRVPNVFRNETLPVRLPKKFKLISVYCPEEGLKGLRYSRPVLQCNLDVDLTKVSDVGDRIEHAVEPCEIKGSYRVVLCSIAIQSVH